MLFRSNDTATTEIYTQAYTLSLHDALPIWLLVQDVQLSTLTFLPADRWWESIYIAATVRGLFGEHAPAVRFISNKRDYTATFGRLLADAGFDPRDVMDKGELDTMVVPTLADYLETAFPMALSVLARGQRSSRRVSQHDGERRGTRPFYHGLLATEIAKTVQQDRKSTRLNSSHMPVSRMPSSA